MKDDIEILRIPEGDFGVNVYLIICAETREAVIIDPAGNGGNVLAAVERTGARICFILNTHGHADHVEANRILKARLEAPVCMHEADNAFFADACNREQIEKELGLPCTDPADLLLTDGQTIPVGNLIVHVLHTPGHTPGSVCYLVDGNLFTGDTLFVGDAGRTDLIGGCLQTLIHSIGTKIMPLPDDTVIWPGHDYGETPTSTVGREKKENPYITDFLYDDEA